MHKSVLLHETIEYLQLSNGDLAIDATCGAGGHTGLLAETVGLGGKVLAIDRDLEAIKIAKKNLNNKNIVFIKGEMADISILAKNNKFLAVSGIVADLGVSSMQIDNPARGFSFKSRGVLDMRMDRSQEMGAMEVVNTYKEEDLQKIFSLYGEEPFSRQVAKAIVELRNFQRIVKTDQLAEVVRRVIRSHRGRSARKSRFDIRELKIDPATKVFQAIRIEVNQELKQLELALPQMVGLLKKGGRIAIISFHSLEDRIVKNYFKEMAKDCICPPGYPDCVCSHRKKLSVVTKKVISPTKDEIEKNPRSRSAKLRVAEKI